MNLTPLIAVHMTAALGAIALGPVALWARRSVAQHPKLHRAFGYAWVTLILVAATSAIFISGNKGFRIAGFAPTHLLIPLTFFMLYRAFVHLSRKNIKGHRLTMQGLYLGACVVAGLFTLTPDRYLGHLVRTQIGLI
jgi:uncharacterized membrane protein